MEIEILMIIEKIKQFSATFDICNILFENEDLTLLFWGVMMGACASKASQTGARNNLLI